jgi:hypothetical protein
MGILLDASGAPSVFGHGENLYFPAFHVLAGV